MFFNRRAHSTILSHWSWTETRSVFSIDDSLTYLCHSIFWILGIICWYLKCPWFVRPVWSDITLSLGAGIFLGSWSLLSNRVTHFGWWMAQPNEQMSMLPVLSAWGSVLMSAPWAIVLEPQGPCPIHVWTNDRVSLPAWLNQFWSS